MFLRVTPVTGVGRTLKSQKLTPRFFTYQILERVRNIVYRVSLPPSLSNIHSVFHVSQLHKHVPNPFHVIQSDNLQIRDNLTYEALPLWIEDREVKHLRDKEIPLVKVVRGGSVDGSVTWDFGESNEGVSSTIVLIT